MPYQTRMYAEGSDQLLKLRNWKIRMTSKGGVFIWYSLVALHFLCGSRTKAKGGFKVEDLNDQILLGQSPCKKVLWLTLFIKHNLRFVIFFAIYCLSIKFLNILYCLQLF